jgi:hypothetical protein
MFPDRPHQCCLEACRGLARGERHCQAMRGRDPQQDAEIRLGRRDLAIDIGEERGGAGPRCHRDHLAAAWTEPEPVRRSAREVHECARRGEEIVVAVHAMLSDEALIRTGERIYMDTWLANQPDGNHTPVRAGRRMRYIDEALRPLGDRLGEPAQKRLRCALALALGTHAVIAMKDSAGLDDDEEIVATLEWAAGALLRTALHDFEGPQ